MTDEIQNRIRYEVNKFIFDHGFAPPVAELSALSGMTVKEVESGLTALAQNHAIVLHPHSFDIWVAHPFALFPTLFWVKTANRQWWGNCPWCSLGIASLVNTDVEIFTKWKGQEEPLKFEIRNNALVQKDILVHFPIPAARFWDNVIYTCSMMLVFRNEAEIEAWCRQHNKPKGEVLPLEQVWALARLWYGNYLDKDFRRKTREVAENMFRQVGLISDFWKL